MMDAGVTGAGVASGDNESAQPESKSAIRMHTSFWQCWRGTSAIMDINRQAFKTLGMRIISDRPTNLTAFDTVISDIQKVAENVG